MFLFSWAIMKIRGVHRFKTKSDRDLEKTETEDQTNLNPVLRPDRQRIIGTGSVESKMLLTSFLFF